MRVRNVVTARFDRYLDARAALREIRRRFAFKRAGISVLVRSARMTAAELRLGETDVRRSMFHGAAWGALGGCFAALLVAVIEGHYGGLHLYTFLFALFAGVIIGVFAGALYGTINPSLALQRIVELPREHGVLVTVEAEDTRTVDIVVDVFRNYGGHFNDDADLGEALPHPA